MHPLLFVTFGIGQVYIQKKMQFPKTRGFSNWSPGEDGVAVAKKTASPAPGTWGYCSLRNNKECANVETVLQV